MAVAEGFGAAMCSFMGFAIPGCVALSLRAPYEEDSRAGKA